MTGIPLNGRQVDLEQLAAELTAAGVPFLGLGTEDGNLITYDDQHQPADLSPSAVAVLSAHVPSTIFRDQMVAILQPLVGITVANLTQPQRLQMLVGIAAAVGAIDRRTLQVRPLNTWLV